MPSTNPVQKMVSRRAAEPIHSAGRRESSCDPRRSRRPGARGVAVYGRERGRETNRSQMSAGQARPFQRVTLLSRSRRAFGSAPSDVPYFCSAKLGASSRLYVHEETPR